MRDRDEDLDGAGDRGWGRRDRGEDLGGAGDRTRDKGRGTGNVSCTGTEDKG